MQAGNGTNGKYIPWADICRAFKRERKLLTGTFYGYSVPYSDAGVEREPFERVMINLLSGKRASDIFGELDYTSRDLEALREKYPKEEEPEPESQSVGVSGRDYLD